MFHDVSHAAARRVRIREELPVEHPGVLDEINGLLDRLPDPEHLTAEQRAGSMAHAAGLRNRLDAWLTALAGSAEVHGDSRVLHAGTTDPPSAGDLRTPTARRADALADLAAAALANTRPLGVSGLSILVDAEHLPEAVGATLQDGYLLGPGGFDLATCTTIATLILGVTGSHTFLPLQLHRSARRASPGQWAALIARDRGCIRCGRAPRYCQAHHIIHWRNGGKTDLSNLALLCSRCHADLHLGLYTITVDPHGIPHINPTPRAPP